jgi:NDP-sugar pyrophosphorylase family protein
MLAMILGAGRGTRLASLGLAVPKILVEIDGAPLLARQLSYLEREGISRVVVNAHHMAEQVIEFAQAYSGPLELDVVVEPRLLGTAGGVRNALDLLGREAFVVLYGDVLLDAHVRPMLEAHVAHNAEATLAVYDSDDLAGKGVVEVGSGERVTNFAEKERSAGHGLVNAGLYVLEPSFVAQLERGVELDFGREVLPAAVERGARIFAFRLARPVIDVGTPESLDYARAQPRNHDRGT